MSIVPQGTDLNALNNQLPGSLVIVPKKPPAIRLPQTCNRKKDGSPYSLPVAIPYTPTCPDLANPVITPATIWATISGITGWNTCSAIGGGVSNLPAVSIVAPALFDPTDPTVAYSPLVCSESGGAALPPWLVAGPCVFASTLITSGAVNSYAGSTCSGTPYTTTSGAVALYLSIGNTALYIATPAGTVTFQYLGTGPLSDLSSPVTYSNAVGMAVGSAFGCAAITLSIGRPY